VAFQADFAGNSYTDPNGNQLMARRSTARKKTRGALLAAIRGLPRVISLRVLAITVLGGIGVVMAFALAITGVTRQRAPDMALQWFPWEGSALSAKGDVLLRNPATVKQEQLDRLGRSALRNLPLNPKALRHLALAAQLRGETKRAGLLIERAADLSRRDALTQLILIDEAIRKDDLPRALRHYDVAMRANGEASKMLFPRLARAIRHPEIRAGLTPYVRNNALWVPEFFAYAKDNAADLSDVVALMLESGGSPDPKVAAAQKADLLWALHGRREFADLKKLLAHGQAKGLAPLSTASLDTYMARERIGPATWVLHTDAQAGAAIFRRPGLSAAAMTVYGNSGTTRMVASKLVWLPAGRYRFLARHASNGQPGDGTATWAMRCLQPFRTDDFWSHLMTSGSAREEIDIPGGCDVQQIELTVSGGIGADGIEFDVTGLAVQPI
jgi:hypothetical protein